MTSPERPPLDLLVEFIWSRQVFRAVGDYRSADQMREGIQRLWPWVRLVDKEDGVYIDGDQTPFFENIPREDIIGVPPEFTKQKGESDEKR